MGRTATNGTLGTMNKGRTKRRLLGILGAVALAALALFAWRRAEPPARAAVEAPAVPVTVAAAATHDVPIFLGGLGTVQAWNTISVRSQINGTLDKVNFEQGQEVHTGDVLAVIDPRALQAALDQAVAKKAQDEATLVDVQKDLDRFKSLAARNFETLQNVDSQQAKVDVARAIVTADQAAIENAQTQLSYATITSPIDGRVGFRQLDAGNIIHSTDTNPLTVITQIKPVQVTFTLPQKDLGSVREAMLAGSVSALAFDQDNAHQLAQGELMLINNQIDQTTSTISLKARFANDNERLWPGEFVRIRIQVATRKDAVTIPTASVQRGPNGLYAWVVKPDNTVEQRGIETTPVDDEVTIVSKGLEPGERVVVTGQYRLEAGARVNPRTEAAAPGKTS
jgi:membrane fusion protein, multidrug efflux system